MIHQNNIDLDIDNEKICVIVEGVDNSGKSTLANYMSKELALDVVHCGPPQTNDPYTEYKLMAENHVPIIFDRYLIGELVYPLIVGRDSNFTSEKSHDLERYLNLKFTVILILCDNDPEEIAKNFKKNKESFLSVDQINDTRELFDKMFEKSQIKHKIRYNYQNDTKQQIVKRIKEILNYGDV